MKKQFLSPCPKSVSGRHVWGSGFDHKLVYVECLHCDKPYPEFMEERKKLKTQRSNY